MELTRFDGHRCFHLCIGPGARGVAQYAGMVPDSPAATQATNLGLWIFSGLSGSEFDS